MEKNFTSRTITGGIILILSLVLIGITVFFMNWVSLIYGIILLILGFYIFLNKNEDKIEKRKDLKGGNKKRK
jgi:c-di-AMP phosphodiesterase-like protein